MGIVPTDDTAAIWIASRETNEIHGVTLNPDQNLHWFASNVLRALPAGPARAERATKRYAAVGNQRGATGGRPGVSAKTLRAVGI